MSDLAWHGQPRKEQTAEQSAVTVLVVEDEALVRMNLADELRSAGYNVIEASNADEAIALLDAGVVPDLLLTDVNMPGSRNGIALAHLVRERLPFARIVVVSSDEHNTPAGLIDAAFSKPYSLPQLLASIETWLSDGKDSA